MLVSSKKVLVFSALMFALSGSALAGNDSKGKEDKKAEVAPVIELPVVAQNEGDSDKERGHGKKRDIFTPALQKDSAQVFTCRVVNIGEKPMAVDINILSSKGVPLETQKSVFLMPGETSSDSTTTKNTIGYGKVMSERPKKLLVTMCNQVNSKGACLAVVTGQ